MKKLTLTLTLMAVALFSTAAMADGITYTTSGQFSCSGNVTTCLVSSTGLLTNNVISIGNGTNNFSVGFASGSGTDLLAPPSILTSTSALFGSFTSRVNGTGATFPTSPIATFTLTITQTEPGPTNTGSFTGNLTGTVQVSGSTGDLVLALDNPTVGINGITYTLSTINDNGTAEIDIVPPSTDANGTVTNGTTTLAGTVAVPEPASLALLGSGLLAGGSFVRRKLIAR